MPPRIAKLAGLGALGASAALLALFLYLVYITRPGRLGGIDSINAAITWISVGGLFIALIAVHILIGKKLLVLSRGPGTKHPL